MPVARTTSKKSPLKVKRPFSKASKSAAITNAVTRNITKLKAKREAAKQANKIIRSLNEAKEIKAGNKTGTTFDDFLDSF